MFAIKIEPFGKITQVKLINTQTGEYVGVLADCGAALNCLVLKKGDKLFDLIDGSETYEQLLTNGLSSFKGSFLFPFTNRLANGKYTFENKTYSFDINDSGNLNNALHGYLVDVKFNIKRFEVFEEKAELELIYEESGQNSSYPFACEVIIKYTFHAHNGLSIQTTVKNLDTHNIPIGFGWHPYFKTSGKVDDIMLQLPEIEEIEINSNMIPTGKLIPTSIFKHTDSVNNTQLDTGFKLKNTASKATISIIDSANSVRVNIWQESKDTKFNFLQVYIPPNRKTIAIEPMTCAADAFNNGMGLQIIAPERTMEASWGIELK